MILVVLQLADVHVGRCTPGAAPAADADRGWRRARGGRGTSTRPASRVCSASVLLWRRALAARQYKDSGA